MIECSNCGRNIPEDEVSHCISCESALCSDCEFNGLCSNCMEIYVEEEDLEAEEGF